MGFFIVRLACVKHATSVHPEPGSNSPCLDLVSFSKAKTSLILEKSMMLLRFKHIKKTFVVFFLKIKLKIKEEKKNDSICQSVQ